MQEARRRDMARSVQNWRTDFMQVHPRLFEVMYDEPERTPGYPLCGIGWRDILERLCSRIEHALANGDRFAFVCVEQKFGTLRLSWAGTLWDESNARVAQAIALAEARSACTCEKCGEEGRLYRHDGVWMTRCPADAKGEPVRIEAGLESFHVIRVTELRDMRVFFCRRYDRAADAFVDIPPDGLEE
ncbi:hypothetical protein AC630_11750 [Bradyrhizobium sp. AS23.2]|nr:hypothetical protein AC630_11750 [Bradyrhizobium sp. AS23.2]